MPIGELSGFRYVANLTAVLRDSASLQFEGISGSVTSDASSAFAVAAAAASASVASRMGESWRQVASLSVDTLNILA